MIAKERFVVQITFASGKINDNDQVHQEVQGDYAGERPYYLVHIDDIVQDPRDSYCFCQCNIHEAMWLDNEHAAISVIQSIAKLPGRSIVYQIHKIYVS